MTRYKLGLVAESTGLPVRQALHEAAKLGVQGLQFDAAGPLAPDALGDTARRELRTLLKSFSLDLAAVHCPIREGLDAFDRQHQRIEFVQKTMAFARDLGCRKLIVPMPAIPPEPAASAEPKVAFTFGTPPERSVTLRESLTALAGFGDRIGVALCLDAGLDAAEKTRDYLAAFDTGSLAVNFDPANFVVNGHDPLTSLSALAKQLGHVHARDARRVSASSGPQEVALGAGDVDWMSFCVALDVLEFGGFVCVERTAGDDRLGDLAAAVRLLRRFVPQPVG